ncbi:hypothetical protein [Streptomyces umbrinus]|uniref:hypothetical protein n=1 Tax=Streptomyces umbrinus TaxID=67370 RepID=UPI00340A62A3
MDNGSQARETRLVELVVPGIGRVDPRVWFFSEASLAHETARTLWALGDFQGAQDEFWRSIHTRETGTFGRTHVVTLGYLGAAQASQGNVEGAALGPKPWTP